MKQRISGVTNLASAILISVCLLGLVPGSIRLAATWKEPYLYGMSDPGFQNFLMLIGFYSLGLEVIGLIAVWIGLVQRKRWAWFSLFVILIFFVFPANILTLVLRMQRLRLGAADWWHLFTSAFAGDLQSIGLIFGVLTFILMLTGLALSFGKTFLTQPQPYLRNGRAAHD